MNEANAADGSLTDNPNFLPDCVENNAEAPTCRPRLYIFNSISPVKSASNTLLAMSEGGGKREQGKDKKVQKKM